LIIIIGVILSSLLIGFIIHKYDTRQTQPAPPQPAQPQPPPATSMDLNVKIKTEAEGSSITLPAIKIPVIFDIGVGNNINGESKDLQSAITSIQQQLNELSKKIPNSSGGGSGGLNCQQVSISILQSVTNLYDQVKEVRLSGRYIQLNKSGLLKQSEIVKDMVKNTICLSNEDKKKLLLIVERIRQDIIHINI
jgi:hypothetical protein